jgi:hypothetical protein
LNAPGQKTGWLLAAGLALTLVGLAAPPSAQVGGDPPSAALPQLTSIANADSNNTMIAVTGIDITGASILYLVDTVNRNLAVYQATGGSENTAAIRLVGARNIDLDLRLDGYNDKSEYSFKDLESRFEELDAR